MRKVIEALEEKYKAVALNVEEEKEVIRYLDLYKRKRDGTHSLLSAMMVDVEKYPKEIVNSGFGHGEKWSIKAASNTILLEEKEIDSEVEEEEESSEKEEEEEEEENDYVNAYEDNDESEFEDELEDVI